MPPPEPPDPTPAELAQAAGCAGCLLGIGCAPVVLKAVAIIAIIYLLWRAAA